MRWTEEQAADHQRRVKAPGGVRLKYEVPTAPKKSKFKNIRCQAKDGTNFASRLERDYYEQLLLRWKAGHEFWFTRQVPFWLEGGVKFVVDFLIVELLPVTHVRLVDTTGVFTQTKRNKIKQLKARYNLDVEIVSK